MNRETDWSNFPFSPYKISYNRGIYELKDLGSAGGTFVKIPFGEKKQLHIGKEY